MDYSYLVLAAVVINRLVELGKQALPENEAINRWKSVILLAGSFVLGSLAVIFVLPTYNLFPQASSPFAGQVFTGILVGGAANGYDWLSGMVQQQVSKPAAPKTVVHLEKPFNG